MALWSTPCARHARVAFPTPPAPAAERGDTRELLDVRVVPNAEVFR